MAFVVDASIAMAWCLPDEAAPATDAVLDSLLLASAVVPPLFAYEVANGLIIARRFGRVSESAAAAGHALLRRLPLAVSDDGQDPSTIVDVATRHRLTAYDAAYLSLAEARALPLATLGTALRKAAKKAGVALV